jgi:hypothetical protein
MILTYCLFTRMPWPVNPREIVASQPLTANRVGQVVYLNQTPSPEIVSTQYSMQLIYGVL